MPSSVPGHPLPRCDFQGGGLADGHSTTEYTEAQTNALLTWKVGFIVDAWGLHLLGKDPFPETVAGWLIADEGLIRRYDGMNDVEKLVNELREHRLSESTQTLLRLAVDNEKRARMEDSSPERQPPRDQGLNAPKPLHSNRKAAMAAGIAGSIAGIVIMTGAYLGRRR